MQLNGASTISALENQFLTALHGSEVNKSLTDAGMSFSKMLESFQSQTAMEGNVSRTNETDSKPVQNEKPAEPKDSKSVEKQPEKEEKVSVKQKKNEAEEKSDVEISDEQLSYLRSSSQNSQADDIIENLEEYTLSRTSEELLSDAQELSVDNPEQFLDAALVARENASAKNISRRFPGLEDKDEKSLQDKSKTEAGRKSKAGLFDIIDQRSKIDQVTETKKSSRNLNAKISAREGNSVDMTLTLNQTANNNILASDSQSAAASGSDFQAMLTEQLTQNAPEFVKAGSIVLKDNKQGTINMILKPESLGNVKVKLNLSDKVITGEIVVHTKEAFEAFKNSMNSLKQAFQQSGFDANGLNLTFADGSSNQRNPSGETQQDLSYQYLSNRVYGNMVEGEAVEVSENNTNNYTSKSIYSIDFVA